MKNYQVTFGKETSQVSINATEAVFSSGKRSRYSFRKIGDRLWLLTIDHKVFTIAGGDDSGKSGGDIAGTVVQFRLNERLYQVTVDDDRSLLVKSLAKVRASSGGPLEIRAPMPGLISRMEVAVGDKVQVGQGLVILEAMKMENEIRSPEHGTVKSIPASRGVAVEKGEVLIVLEPD